MEETISTQGEIAWTRWGAGGTVPLRAGILPLQPPPPLFGRFSERARVGPPWAAVHLSGSFSFGSASRDLAKHLRDHPTAARPRRTSASPTRRTRAATVCSSAGGWRRSPFRARPPGPPVPLHTQHMRNADSKFWFIKTRKQSHRWGPFPVTVGRASFAPHRRKGGPAPKYCRSTRSSALPTGCRTSPTFRTGMRAPPPLGRGASCRRSPRCRTPRRHGPSNHKLERGGGERVGGWVWGDPPPPPASCHKRGPSCRPSLRRK